MSIYRKEYSRANQAHADLAGPPLGQAHLYDGWAIFKRNEDHDGVHDDLIAVVDTETLADTMIAALNAKQYI